MPFRLAIFLITSLGASSGVALSEEALDQAVEESVRGARAGAASQRLVNELDDEARALFVEYRAVIRNVETLETYVKRLRELVADQEEDVRRRQADIDNVETFERELFPAMERMMDALKRFIRADLPFLRDERDQRVARLDRLMSRSDVTASEKFRQLMEAYQIESDYGRTIEAYRGTVDEAERERVVDFLRVGRSLLAYQTLDGVESAVWDPTAAVWLPLDAAYHADVRRGLRIARKQAAPDLLILPFTAPVDLETLQ